MDHMNEYSDKNNMKQYEYINDFNNNNNNDNNNENDNYDSVSNNSDEIDYDTELAIAYQKIGELEYKISNNNDNNNNNNNNITDIISYQSEHSQNPVVINDILYNIELLKMNLISIAPFVTYASIKTNNNTNTNNSTNTNTNSNTNTAVYISESSESSELIDNISNHYTCVNDKRSNRNQIHL